MSGPTREISDANSLEESPLVSVLMLAYCHERFLSEAIEGVVAQSCDFPFELIIAEDCSPDGTLDIALEYQRRYSHLIRIRTADQNLGMHQNYSRAISAVRGQYIALCEGDDYWHHPHKLQMQVDLMRTRPQVSLCHTDYDRRFRFGIRRSCHERAGSPHLAEGQAYESLLHEWTVMTATAMYRTGVLHAFETSGFNEQRWPFGDYNKALFAAANGRVGYIPVSTATWRKVSGSATNNDVRAYLSMALAYEECRERFMQVYPVSAQTALGVRTESKTRVMNRAFWAGRMDLFDESRAWLCEHARTPSVPVTTLKRLILRSPLLTRGSKSFRTLIRNLRLMSP